MLEKLLLRRRQVEARAVSSSESVSVYVHLLAFDPRRKTEHHYDQIRLARRGESFFFTLTGTAPDQPCLSSANRLVLLNLHFVGVVLLQVRCLGFCGGGTVSGPVFGDEIIVEPHTVAILPGKS